ncbi:MAG: radical SAM protein [bacterium]|nr:radical SAM protein [bacterium]
MKPVVIPESYNYIGVFLTFACNLKCSYCINRFDTFIPKGHLTGEQWVESLNRIVSRDDLPVTIQGGEPSLHPDFYYIINHIKKELHIDILTNLQFDVDTFIRQVDPARIKRKAPYASIRVSYHPDQMDTKEMVRKVLKLQDAGFSIGIWGVLHPLQKETVLKIQEECKKAGIDFRTKEFLGFFGKELYGTYKYPGAFDQEHLKKCRCRTTELLIGPDGNIYRCHSDVYSGRKPIGSINAPEYQLQDIYRDCDYFGLCNPCDIKIKTNRFQQFGHTSVDIKL